MMNVRMPADMDKETQRIQDDYLKERIKENGIVSLNEINTIDEFSNRRPQAENCFIPREITDCCKALNLQLERLVTTRILS